MILENAWLVKTLLNLQASLGDFSLRMCLIPYQGGCFQCLVSSIRLHCSICDWEFVIFTTFRQHHLWMRWVVSMDFRRVHLFQLLKIHDQLSPFQIPPRAIHNRERFLEVLSFQIDGFLTDPSWIKDDIQPMNQMESLVLWNGPPKLLSDGVFTSDNRSLNNFADNSNIPWNPPTNFHPSLIATTQDVPSSILACCSLSNPICFWTVRSWCVMIPR